MNYVKWYGIFVLLKIYAWYYFCNIQNYSCNVFIFKYEKKTQFYSTDEDVGYDFKSLFDSQAGWRFRANCFTTLSSSPPPLRFAFSIALVSY
jgi:hypothetical protein